MRFLKVILSTIIFLLAIVFIIENLEILRQTVILKLDLYLANLESPTVPLWVIILFCFFLGVFTASLYGIYEIILQRHTIRQLQHNLEILAQELKSAGAAAASPGPKVTSPGE
jgi:lipopolysaccharide assembly protein A